MLLQKEFNKALNMPLWLMCNPLNPNMVLAHFICSHPQFQSRRCHNLHCNFISVSLQDNDMSYEENDLPFLPSPFNLWVSPPLVSCTNSDASALLWRGETNSPHPPPIYCTHRVIYSSHFVSKDLHTSPLLYSCQTPIHNTEQSYRYTGIKLSLLLSLIKLFWGSPFRGIRVNTN